MALVPISPETVRQRIAAAVDAVDGWAEFSGLPSQFPQFAARPINHKHFSVDLLDVEIEEDRQKSIGVPVWQRVTVRWSYLIRASDGRDDYDLALIEEAKIVKAIRFAVGTDGPTCKITGIARAPIAEGTYLLGTITANAWHVYLLA